MGQMPEDVACGGPAGDVYQECLQELRLPYPDYAQVQPLATLSLVETGQEVASQLAELNRHRSHLRQDAARWEVVRHLCAGASRDPSRS